MRLKVFRATGMADAMARVRAELGPEALILNTRAVPGGIEITAASEPTPEPVPNPPPPQVPLQSNAKVSTALAWHGVPSELRPSLAGRDLETALATALTFGALPLEPHGPPILLTGPPGGGKTLTAVRLATRLVMRGAVPLVVTMDGKRAGATEQIAVFTRLLNVPMLIAHDAAGITHAVSQRRDGAPVLIDTAGDDPREPGHARELKTIAAAARAHVALVLPSGLDPAEAAELSVAHAACGAISMIVTKLDVMRRLGGVMAAAASRLVLTDAGIGSGASDGLVPLTPSLLAARLSRFERQ